MNSIRFYLFCFSTKLCGCNLVFLYCFMLITKPYLSPAVGPSTWYQEQQHNDSWRETYSWGAILPYLITHAWGHCSALPSILWLSFMVGVRMAVLTTNNDKNFESRQLCILPRLLCLKETTSSYYIAMKLLHHKNRIRLERLLCECITVSYNLEYPQFTNFFLFT